MNVQNINLFKINSNFTQSKNNKSSNNINHTYPQVKDISNHFYVPFCGKKEEDSIQSLLNNKTFEQEKKDYLSFLTTIDGFNDATKGMNKDELKDFVSLALFFSPVIDDILKGNYKCVFGNTEKPLFDLKGVAEYNRKYPQNPQNLNDMLFTDNSLIKIFLSILSAKKINELSRPMQVSYFLDTEKNLQAKTIIKYSPQNKISKKEIQKYADTPINQNARTLFDFQSIPFEMKKTLWELTEIPYFNALSKNLQLDQLELLMDFTNDNKAFVLEALKGNVLQINKETKEEKPIIDLKQIVENNLKSNYQKQQDIFEEFLNNKLFKECYEETFLYKNTMKKYPNYFFAFTESPNEIIPSFRDYSIEDLVSSYVNPKLNVNRLIVFKNNLNLLSPISAEKKEKIFELKIKSLEERRNFKTPDIVHEYLHAFKNDNLKKIVYNFENDIPYFNYLMKDAKIEDLELLVELKNKNSRIFDKLISGKIKIKEGNAKEKQAKGQPLVNIEKLALSKTGLETIINRSTLAYEICKELINNEKLFEEEIKSMTIKVYPEKNPVVSVVFKSSNENYSGMSTYLPRLPQAINEYLQLLEKKEITILIED